MAKKTYWTSNLSGILVQYTPLRGWFVSNQYCAGVEWIHELPKNWAVICYG